MSRLMLVFTVFLFIACGEAEFDQEATISAGVAGTANAVARESTRVHESVMATMQAIPIATAQSTFTPLATLVPLPTYTPYPTHTPYPTYTPFPTATDFPIPTTELEPTKTPTSAPQSQQTTPPQTVNVSAKLLDAMTTIRLQMEESGSLVDTAFSTGFVDCSHVVLLYDTISVAPTFEMGASSSTIQHAYNEYRRSINIFTSGGRDMAQNCRDFLNNPDEGTTIPFQQWGTARQAVSDALSVLIPAISLLESQ